MSETRKAEQRLTWIGTDEMSLVGLAANEERFRQIKGIRSEAMSGTTAQIPDLKGLDSTDSLLKDLAKALEIPIGDDGNSGSDDGGEGEGDVKKGDSKDPAARKDEGKKDEAQGDVQKGVQQDSEVMKGVVSALQEISKATRTIINEYNSTSKTTENVDLDEDENLEAQAMSGKGKKAEQPAVPKEIAAIGSQIEALNKTVAKLVGDEDEEDDSSKAVTKADVVGVVKESLAPILEQLQKAASIAATDTDPGNAEDDEDDGAEGGDKKTVSKSKGNWSGILSLD